jgi:hypothetical protein
VASFISDMRFDELVSRELEELEKVENPEQIKITYKLVCEDGGFLLWNCSMSRESARVSVEGSFLVLQTGNFVFMLSGQPPRFLRECIMYLAKDMYPNIMIAYITAEEIFEILQRFSKTKETELLYSKSVTKRMFGKSFTSLGYATTKEPFTEAFAKAHSLGLWIDSIRVVSADNSRVDFRLSRSGLLTYYNGSFEEFYDNVLILMEEYCSQRMKMFEKRGRKERNDREPQPLLLKFDSRVFEDTFIRKQLINVISEYDFCNYSVIHEGNPHVYINREGKITEFSM